MTYVVTTPPATEPLTIAEVKSFARVDSSNAEPAPDALTAALASPAAPGNVDNGAHRYLATFVTAAGETQAGVPTAAVTVVDKTVNGKVALTAIPVGGAAVTARKVYRTIAGGATYLLLATIADNTTTTYTDNIADSALGAGAPSVNTTDDSILTTFIAAARAHAEQDLHRYLITQTVDVYLDRFPCRGSEYAILLPPIQSVSAITYVDSNGVTQTLATDQYTVDANSRPARITPSYGNSWPSARDQANAVKVRIVAGYGAAAAVPACIRQWMLLRIKAMYDNRDQFAFGTVTAQLPQSYVDGLLDPERVPGWI